MNFRFYLVVMAIAFISVHAQAAAGERRTRDERDFTGGTSWGSTREEVVGNRNKRRRQLNNLVNHLRKKLADHSAGEITLDPKEKADMERRLDLYSRKVESMKEDLEEKDIERIIARTATQKKRREMTKEEIFNRASIATDEL